jgi:hypothetical protein
LGGLKGWSIFKPGGLTWRLGKCDQILGCAEGRGRVFCGRFPGVIP